MAHVEVTEVVVGEVMVQSPRPRSLAASIEQTLGLIVEIPAAILVVAEIVILFAGVVARYGLHRPLVWSDELASILFLWLAMLGAAVAFRRSEHMRMTAVVARAEAGMRAYLDAVATCAALAFLLMIVWPAFDSSWIRSQNARRAIGSTPDVGSSRKSTEGSCRIAQPSASRCFQPPERVRVIDPRRSARFAIRST